MSLVKPHYEIGRGDVSDEELGKVLENVKREIKDYVRVVGIVESPLLGVKGKNKEFLMLCEYKVK